MSESLFFYKIAQIFDNAIWTYKYNLKIQIQIQFEKQVEDGRDGGNPEFDGEVTDQYTAEVTLAFKGNLLPMKYYGNIMEI